MLRKEKWKMKYYVIPKKEVMAMVDAEHPPKISSAASKYFRVVTEDEYNRIESERCAEYEKKFKIEFFTSELINGFDVSEEDVQEIAERAYEIYCDAGRPPYCDISTEYDALERAFEECQENVIEITYEVTRRTCQSFKVNKRDYEKIRSGGEIPEEIIMDLEHAIDTGDCDREDDYEVINGKTGEVVIPWND
jgi:hypothetical protein